MLFRKQNLFFLFCFLLILSSCSSVPKGAFDPTCTACPDYSNEKYWAALPGKKDSADAVPLASWNDVQSTSPVDVFFLHPTTYTGKRGQNQWNADVNNVAVNLRTDEYPIRYQASVFNGAGRIYAPRYRQAHLECFYKPDENATRASDLAYEDIRSAFEYYVANYNAGRPFIIAAHSQGSFHAVRLMKELIDGTPLQHQLVVAYIVGWAVPVHTFNSIPVCLDSDDTGCFCTWRTVREGALPSHLHFPDKNIVVTNPVTWTTGEEMAEKDQHVGAILRDFHTLVPGLLTARVHQDFLWVSKPQFPGSLLLMTDNYHIADYNFFYADVRHNAQERVKAYLRKL
jgi:hypothetical protein